VARALIVGCGCRGRMLGERLLAEGWEVRGTSRREESLAPIRAAGIEPAVADPLWPGTVLDLVGDVALVVWALGSAHADGEEGGSGVEAIHGDRLERMLERLVETPVRGFVYEAAGSVEAGVLDGGVRAVEAAASTWRIPVETVTAEASDPDRWVSEMAAAAGRLVG
jgi:nucleoside-diphosphate-sugar epimerase